MARINKTGRADAVSKYNPNSIGVAQGGDSALLKSAYVVDQTWVNEYIR